MLSALQGDVGWFYTTVSEQLFLLWCHVQEGRGGSSIFSLVKNCLGVQPPRGLGEEEETPTLLT